MSVRLTRRFFRRDPLSLARALLGQTLIRVLDDGTRLAGRIVETEAYLGVEDRAAHTFGGRRTKRNASMYLDAGHAYVYFTYGMHWCLNVTADREGVPTACLIRALEPLEGVERMWAHRCRKIESSRLRDTDLCSGPAKLAQALGIDQSFDGIDLTGDARLFLEKAPRVADNKVVAAGRVGVGYAGDWAAKPLRFYTVGCPHVSVRLESHTPGEGRNPTHR